MKSKAIALVALVLAVSLCSLTAIARRDDAEAERTKAAQDLLVAMNSEAAMNKGITEMLDMQMKQNPMMEKFRPEMEAFFAKYMSWDSLKDEVAKAYADEFSTEELKQLTEFYNSPVGKKLADKQPAIAAKMMAVGQSRVQEHQAELTAAIQKKMQDGGN